MFVLINFWNPPLMISVSRILAVNGIIYVAVTGRNQTLFLSIFDVYVFVTML